MSMIMAKSGSSVPYGYNIAFLDKNKKLVGRLLDTMESTNKHINLTPEEIASIRFYKMLYFEATGELLEDLLIK